MEKFAVAPMIDWTDRHCRYFHHVLSKRAELYTEMVVDQAILRGDAPRLLDADAPKDNVVLQLGGSEPESMGQAARIGAEFGYEAINLNCGCPSDRVQSGAFGAVLMLEPERVRDILVAMQEMSGARISLKIRLGVDEQNEAEALPCFLEAVLASGVDEVTIHARKAWLRGLSPKENRSIPPLDYDLAARMRARFEGVKFALNGGIENLEMAKRELGRFDGVMIGRAAYQRPYDVLAFVDEEIYGEAGKITRSQVIEIMSKYLEKHVAAGGGVGEVVRHMMGLFHGQKGGRIWRQMLSEEAKKNDPNLLKQFKFEEEV